MNPPWPQRRPETEKRRYVDLCNEQLAYLQNGYLPREVMEEWLDGMLYRLPLWKAPEAEEIHPEHPGEIEEELFERYSRIRKAFAVDEPWSLTSPDQREDLIRQLRENVEPRNGVRPLMERAGSYLPNRPRSPGRPPDSGAKTMRVRGPRSERRDPGEGGAGSARTSRDR